MLDVMCMFCKSREVALCGWRGYKPSANKQTNNPLAESPRAAALLPPAERAGDPPGGSAAGDPDGGGPRGEGVRGGLEAGAGDGRPGAGGWGQGARGELWAGVSS